MLDIVAIIGNLIFERVLLSPIDLCHTSNPWLDRQYLIVVLFIRFDFSRLMRARSYERHISYEDVIELREFVDRELLYDASDTSLARVIRDLIERSLATILSFFELFLVLERAILSCCYSIAIFHRVFPVHVAEFIEKKLFSRIASSSVLVYDRTTWIFELDEKGDHEK